MSVDSERLAAQEERMDAIEEKLDRHLTACAEASGELLKEIKELTKAVTAMKLKQIQQFSFIAGASAAVTVIIGAIFAGKEAIVKLLS